MLALALTSLWLAACSADPNRPALSATDPAPPPPPPLPADIRACPTGKHKGAVRKYSVGEVEAILEIERGKIDKLNGCLVRLICSTAEYRAKISKVEGERLCRATR